MALEKYRDQYGKLEFTVTIPIDSEMNSTIAAARAKKIKVLAWARDLLQSHLHELEDEIQVDAVDHAFQSGTAER